MKKDYKILAEEILKAIGGEKNVSHATHCATRLRFNLVDDKKVNESELKKINGVMGSTNQGGQFQVIIGNEVSNVFNELIKIGKFDSNQKENESAEKKGIISKGLDVIAGVFTPILPALAGAGMLKAILALLTTFGVISAESQGYIIFSTLADTVFYFLPIVLAYTSAEKFKCSKFLAVIIAGFLVHPDLSALLNSGEAVKLFGLPITNVTYTSSVIPIILSVWAMSYIEKFADKISPKAIKLFFKPLVTLVITAPIAIIAIGPLGTFLGDGLAYIITALSTSYGLVVTVALGALIPILTMTGMHYALFPMIITSLTTTGFDSILAPVALGANLAQGGAALCVAVKTKNKNLKQLAASTGFTATLGITEPAMYGVNLKLKRPFIGVIIGGAVASLYAGITGVKAAGMVSPGLPALPLYMNSESLSLLHAIVTCLIGFGVAFIATWFLGFEDEEDNSKKSLNTEDKSIKKLAEKIQIMSPLEGNVVELSELKDETFSIMGKGVAIDPYKGKLVSPVNGVVETVFKTKHAIGIKSDDGAEILIHIGIDTVKLEGKYFESFINAGDRIKVGDKLVDFDIENIQKAGYETVTSVIVTNQSEYLEVLYDTHKEVKCGDTLLNIM